MIERHFFLKLTTRGGKLKKFNFRESQTLNFQFHAKYASVSYTQICIWYRAILLEDASNASMPLCTILVIFAYPAILLYNVRIVLCSFWGAGQQGGGWLKPLEDSLGTVSVPILQHISERFCNNSLCWSTTLGQKKKICSIDYLWKLKIYNKYWWHLPLNKWKIARKEISCEATQIIDTSWEYFNFSKGPCLGMGMVAPQYVLYTWKT